MLRATEYGKLRKSEQGTWSLGNKNQLRYRTKQALGTPGLAPRYQNVEFGRTVKLNQLADPGTTGEKGLTLFPLSTSKAEKQGL